MRVRVMRKLVQLRRMDLDKCMYMSSAAWTLISVCICICICMYAFIYIRMNLMRVCACLSVCVSM